MAASIDGNEFDSWKGYLRQAPPRRVVYDQMGVNGDGITFGGRNPGEQVITTKNTVDDVATATALENTYRLLEESAVTVVDPLGRTFANTVVAQVMCDVYGQVSTGGTTIETTWVLIIEAVDPS